jgi:hypothetical protein
MVPRIAYIPSKNSCCFVPAKPEEHIGNSHKLSQIERLLDFASPFSKRERMKVRVCFAVAPRECEPDCSQDAIEFSANLMIPESQHNDSMAREEFRPRAIANLACTIIMSTAV